MTKPKRFTARDLDATREMLARTRSQHSPQDHARLEDMVEILAEVMAMVRASDDNDDTPVGEELFAQAIERVRARKPR